MQTSPATQQTRRIEYLDALRGLCMILIVWYHTDHPQLLDYGFYNFTLFFLSGMLFKPGTEGLMSDIKKRAKRLLVPFLFFYLLYYAFVLCLNFAKHHYLSPESIGCALDLFRLHSDNDAFRCNYPLWFLLALFWVNIMASVLTRLTSNAYLLGASSLLISILGFVDIQHIPTPLIIGRSFTFVFFFMAGYILKDIKLGGYIYASYLLFGLQWPPCVFTSLCRYSVHSSRASS